MRKSNLSIIPLILGYVFLYTPIIILIAFSFNASKQITVWTGFSWRWYVQLFSNQEMLKATWTSLKIAFICASLSTVLGTISALVLSKFKHFKGKGLFQGLVTAPLVMPEIIMGLGFLLLFFNLESLIGWPKAGTVSTITLAHTTLAIAYVCAIIHTQLSIFDQSLLDAAMDLGARPLKVFFKITLPILAPSLLSGWFLSFVLSMDDLIVSSFVGGPDATTLPMIIYSSVKFGISPQINALATLIVLLIFLSLSIVYILHQQQKKSLDRTFIR
ncbi:MAG: ABC transporter permease [Alphaproteobacteria bacterium]